MSRLTTDRTARGPGDLRRRGVRGRLRQQRRQHHRRQRGGGGEKLTVGSDIPYPPFEEFGKTEDRIQGLRHRTGGSDRRRRSAARPNSRTPRSTRSSATSPRASSTWSPRRRRSPTNARKRSTSPTPTTCVGAGDPGQEGRRHRLGRRTSNGATVGVQKGTTGRGIRRRKGRHRGNSAPTRRARTPSPALKAGTVDAVVIDSPVAENAVEADSGIEISGRDPETEEQYGFVGRPGRHRTARRTQRRRSKEVIDDGTYTTIYKKWFHKPVPPKEIASDARSGLSRADRRDAER